MPDSRESPVRIGVDLGGTKIYALILGENWKILGSARSPSNGHLGPEAGLETIVETVDNALKEAGLERADAFCLGIGCPGVVDLKAGELKVAPNLGWEDVPIRRKLEAAFHCPITVLNDVDAGTYGEYRFGAGVRSDSLLGVFPGTGLGGGFVFHGTILSHKRFSCMELGDLPMAGTTLLRPGDEWPTLEDLTSRLAITSAVAVEAFRGKAKSLVDLPLSKIKSKNLSKAIESGEASVASVIDRSIDYLSRGVAGAVSLLGPDRIVMGGGLVDRFPGRYIDGVQKGLERFVKADLAKDIVVVKAALGDDAVAKGAAAYAKHGMEKA